MHEWYGPRELNVNGKSIVDCMLTFDLTIVNMCFRKIKKHFITYLSEMSCSQMNFFFFI